MPAITIYPDFYDNLPIDSINKISLILDRISDSAIPENKLNLLSIHEIDRYSKFHNPIDKNIYAVSHIGLRLLIAKSLNIDIDKISIDYPLHGKPKLLNKNNDFSLTHSNNIFSIGICLEEGMIIGIDIEKIIEIQSIDEICNTYMHEQESAYINSAIGIEKTKRFLMCWTRKEAILKMLGIGLINELDTVCTVGKSNAIHLDIPFLDFPDRINAMIYTNIGIDHVLSCSISNIKD